MATTHDSSDYLLTRYLNESGLISPSTVALPRHGIALFGLGRAGSIHLSNIARTARYRLRYIVDSDSARLQHAKITYCLDDTVILLKEQEADKIYKDQSVTAVIVATPSGNHEKYVAAALSAGKHVLCEKPVALSLSSIKACYQLASKNDRILLCAFNRRYDPAFSTIAAAVKAGAVGQLQSISTVARDSPKPTIAYLKQSGGIFHDCIVHDVDLICHVVGEFPEKVFAAAHAFDPNIAAISDHDTVSVTLKFPSGLLGHVDISRHAQYGYDQRLEVFGSKGMVKSENQRPNTLLASTSTGCTLSPILHSFPSRYCEAYTRQLEHFVELLDGTEQLKITEDTVVSVTKIIEALEESVRAEAFVTVEY